MWECPKCGQQVQDAELSCWSCGTSKSSIAVAPVFLIRVFSVMWFLLCGLFVVGGLAFLGFTVFMPNVFDSPLERIGFAAFSIVFVGIAIAFIFFGKKHFTQFWK